MPMIVPYSRRWPRIVAESLAAVTEPAATAGKRPVAASIDEIHAAISAAAAPGRSALRPPAFLQLHQIDAWRRVHHALTRYGGALLAEPTGSGKSWIALALAAIERRRSLVIAPAVLHSQWAAVSHQSGVAVNLWSHERVSRGTLPDGSPELVIVDEAHRFRDLSTRRVRVLAPWLVGRRVLLLTATPIVNRIDDLINLLRLVLPDDVLVLDGVPTLGGLGAGHSPPVALHRVVVRTAVALVHAERALQELPPQVEEEARGARAVAQVDQLVLSHHPAVRRLVRTVLLDAAASSDVAFRAALRRYRSLLLHSRDAGGLSRATIRRFAGDALDQLVLWEVLTPASDAELATEDIQGVDQILGAPLADDAWITSLREALPQTGLAVCFTRHRATAQLLRRAFGDGAAWVTGSDAGIGPHRLARGTVLEAFGPRRDAWCARRTRPDTLIATDVAAEGLDLQAAGTLAHVDLPWTAMRIAQREGRLLRIGQTQTAVRIVVRLPARAIESALAPQQRIRRKESLSTQWLNAVASATQPQPTECAPPRVAIVDDGGPDATLVAVTRSRGPRVGLTLITRVAGGEWDQDPAAGAALLHRARSTTTWTGSTPSSVQHELGLAMQVALRTPPALPPSSLLIARIQRLARAAAARRDANALDVLDRLLRFAATSASLGGRLRLEHLEDRSDAELLRSDLPDIPRPGAVAANVVAAILFRSAASTLRCPDA